MAYTNAQLVANCARNIEVKNGRAATMTENDLQDFIRWAENVVDSRLSALYYTPLRQITRSDDTRYPFPIEMITTNLAAGYAVEAVYARIEPQVSDAGKAHKDSAFAELDELCNGVLVGSRVLEGQTRKSRNPFVNPNAAPLEPPKGQGF